MKQTKYPVQFDIDYPTKSLDKLSTFFRIIFAIPILVVLIFLTGFNRFCGILFPAVLTMILFKQKYPKWWFDWNLNLTRFSNRIAAYLFLLRDEYPSTDSEQTVNLKIVYPNAKKDLNRWLPLVKWFLAIPHFILLLLLSIAAVFAVIFAWFAILFTGRYPKGIFDFVVGTMRWNNRVSGYAFLLVTDKYPPFSLE